MQRRTKRLLSVLLVLTLMLTALPSQAWAVESSGTDASDAQDALYESLTAAIDDASEGDVITLVRNEELTEPLVINKAITLDGNGYTLTYTGRDRAVDIPNGTVGEVTILDLTVLAPNAERGISFNATGALTLNGVTVDGVDGGLPIYAVNVPAKATGATVEIAECSLTGLVALNIWSADMTVAVIDSDLYSVDNTTVENYATIQLNNDGTNAADGTVVTVTGGLLSAYDSTAEEGETRAVVSNWTATGTVEISDTTHLVGTRQFIVAMIAGAGYASLTAAINAAKDGDVITLLRDVIYTTETAFVNGSYVDGVKYMGDKSFTIDLNGCTVTDDGCVNDYLLYFTNRGEKVNAITIKNGTIVAKNGCWATICVGSGSDTYATTLSLENVEVENSNADVYAGNLVVRVRNGSVVNISNGSSIVSDNGSAAVGAATADAVLNVYDATLTQKNSGKSVANGNNVYACVTGVGQMNIYEGAVLVSDVNGIHPSSSGAPVVNVLGGSITAPNAIVLTTNGAGTECVTVNVKGGTINGALSTMDEGCHIVISGGCFDQAVAEKYCDEGYLLARNTENGTYTVLENLYFEYLGTDLKQKDQFETADLRYSYAFADDFVLTEWSWVFYAAVNANYKKTVEGVHVTADNVTRLVVANLGIANWQKDVCAQLCFSVVVDGVTYIVYDEARAASVYEVAEDMINADGNEYAAAARDAYDAFAE